jgi:TolA-binding protein
MNTNRSMEAIKFYDRILTDFPDYRKAPEALFLKGYVYENNLGRLDKAKEIYETFMAKYPENEFADDAKVSLQYLGKSPEELIEIFQKSDSTKIVGK